MRQRLPRLVGVLGGLLAIVGIIVFVLASGGPDVVVYDGSYEPLDTDSAYDSSLTLDVGEGFLVAWSTQQALGAALAVSGLLVLAALGGWLLGRRAVPRAARR